MKTLTLVEHASRAAALGDAARHVARAAGEAIRLSGRFAAAISPALAEGGFGERVVSSLAAHVNPASVHLFAADSGGPLADFASALRLPARNVHAPRGVEDDPLAAAANYEQLLRAWFRLAADRVPSFDLVLLAAGESGEVAGLSLGQLAADETGRLAVADCTAAPFAPVVSLTLAVVQAARERVLLAPARDLPFPYRLPAAALGRSLRLTWPHS